VFLDRDASTVVNDSAPPVGQDRHVDPGAVAGHRLINGVVDHFPDQVVKP
jgi:hypothetical protein